MEDILLLDAIERYLNNQMLAEEKAWFTKLRENTPEIDQMVVEHKLFLQQINDFADNAALKHTIAQAHENLAEKGEIYSDNKTTVKGKVIQLFHRYKKVTAIAASIAGVTALTISVLVAALSPKTDPHQLVKLGGDVKSLITEVKKLKQIDAANKYVGAPIGSGTAFLIDGKGYLVTNAHVLKGTSAQVVDDKGDEYNTRIISIDNTRDLAILKINDEDFKPLGSLPYAVKKNNVSLGEDLFTLGYPRDEITYSLGYLSAESGNNGDTTSCQVFLSANPGNSGSPVFNKNGDVVGVLTAKQQQAEGVVYALKAKDIFQMIDDLRESDTAVQKIKVSNNSSLHGQSRTDQISKVRDCIFLVKAYGQK